MRVVAMFPSCRAFYISKLNILVSQVKSIAETFWALIKDLEIIFQYMNSI